MGYKPKVLFYDIETSLVKFLSFRTGKQVLTHKNLFPRNQITELIMIQYMWDHDKKARALLASPYDSSDIIKQFDEMVKKADIVIGKNNSRFDNKHINTHRLLNDKLEAIPEWMANKSEDLEKQMRKHFNLQSYSLDYFSELLGLGGKDKMDYQDWVNIYAFNDMKKLTELAGDKAVKKICKHLYGKCYTDIRKDGISSLFRMNQYGCKDVEDTKAIWNYCKRHFTPKHSYSGLYGAACCKICGSTNTKCNGYYTSSAGVKYVNYYCNDHNGYAGKKLVTSKKDILK